MTAPKSDGRKIYSRIPYAILLLLLIAFGPVGGRVAGVVWMAVIASVVLALILKRHWIEWVVSSLMALYLISQVFRYLTE